MVWQKSWAIRFPSPRALAQAVVWRDLAVVRTSTHDPHEVERMKTLLYAYDGASGWRDWVASFPGELVSDPAAANGRLFLALPAGGLVAVDENDGSTVWMQALAGLTLHSPAVMGGRIFITSRNGDLYAFAESDGALLWSAPLAGQLAEFPLRSPVVDGQTVYVASEPGDHGGVYVEAFSAADGTKKYTRTVGAGAYTGDLAGANGVLYLGSDDGNLYALDAGDGTPLLALPLGEAVSAPAIAHGHVYAGTSTGIFALSVPASAL